MAGYLVGPYGDLVAEYLPDVNEQVRGRFLDAVHR